MNALSGPPWKGESSSFEFIQRIGTSDENEVSSFVNAEIDARRPIYGFDMEF